MDGPGLGVGRRPDGRRQGGRRPPVAGRGGQALLAVAVALLVGADSVARLTAHRVAGPAGCGRTTSTNVLAPVLLVIGGFVAVMALVTRLATAGGQRLRWGWWIAGWLAVIVAFAVSGLVIYVAAALRLCG